MVKGILYFFKELIRSGVYFGKSGEVITIFSGLDRVTVNLFLILFTVFSLTSDGGFFNYFHRGTL